MLMTGWGRVHVPDPTASLCDQQGCSTIMSVSELEEILFFKDADTLALIDTAASNSWRAS